MKSRFKIFNVKELNTHGGSLRVYGCLKDFDKKINASVETILAKEKDFGITNIEIYKSFQKKVEKIKFEFLELLTNLKSSQKLVVGYGAAAKGNTLLNYCGIKKDLINCVFDVAESKQFKFLPGSHIPILPPSYLDKKIPDYIIIFPWNISEEIVNQLRKYRNLGVKFITIIPSLKIF